MLKTLIKHSRAAWALLIIGLGMALAAISSFIIAANARPEEFGVYSIVLSLLNFICLYSSLGNGAIIIRSLPIYRRQGSALESTFIAWALKESVKRSAVVTLGVATVYFLVYLLAPEKPATAYLAVGALIFPLSFELCLMSVLRARGKVIPSLAPYYIFRYLIVITVILLFVWASIDLRSVRLVMVELLALTVVAAVSFIYMVKSSKTISFLDVLNPVADSTQKIEWLGKARSLTKSSLSQQIISNVDIAMVGFLFGAHSAGVYALGAKLSRVVLLGNKAVNEYIGPSIASAYSERDTKKLRRIAVVSCRLAGLISLSFVVIYSILSDYLLSFLDDAYLDVSEVTWVLLMARLVTSFTGPTGIMMNMTDCEHLQTYINAIAALILVLLFLVLSLLNYSVLSAAVAYALVVFFSNLAKIVVIRVKVGVLVLPV